MRKCVTNQNPQAASSLSVPSVAAASVASAMPSAASPASATTASGGMSVNGASASNGANTSNVTSPSSAASQLALTMSAINGLNNGTGGLLGLGLGSQHPSSLLLGNQLLNLMNSAHGNATAQQFLSSSASNLLSMSYGLNGMTGVAGGSEVDA